MNVKIKLLLAATVAAMAIGCTVTPADQRIGPEGFVVQEIALRDNRICTVIVHMTYHAESMVLVGCE